MSCAGFFACCSRSVFDDSEDFSSRQVVFFHIRRQFLIILFGFLFLYFGQLCLELFDLILFLRDFLFKSLDLAVVICFSRHNRFLLSLK